MATLSPSLTIGIPTYNRCETVTRLVAELLRSGLPPVVDVLVLDNASRDGTFDVLRERCGDAQVRVLRNDQNIGFAGSFVRLFKEASGDYLLITSDEDLVLVDALPALLELCAATSPGLISPQVFMERGAGPELYRGRRTTGRIRPEAFLDCGGYVSGMTFQVAGSAELVQMLETARTSNDAAHLYPHDLLAAGLIARGNCYWLDQPLTAATDPRIQLPTRARDLRGVPYGHLSSRWAQFLGRDAFLQELSRQTSSQEERIVLGVMRDSLARGLYQVLRSAVEHERADIVGQLDAGVRRHLLHSNRLLRRAAFVAHDPREAAVEWRRRVAARLPFGH